jgi:hypothetical protein
MEDERVIANASSLSCDIVPVSKLHNCQPSPQLKLIG